MYLYLYYYCLGILTRGLVESEHISTRKIGSKPLGMDLKDLTPCCTAARMLLHSLLPERWRRST